VTALDAPTQPRVARWGPARGRVPPRRPSPRVPTAVLVPSAVPTPSPRPTAGRPRPRRSARVALAAGALAAGLLTGAALAVLGLRVAPTAAGPDRAAAVRAVQRVGIVGPGPQPVDVTFTMDTGSGLPGLGNTITYQAVGTDSATVDLTQVAAADVQVHGSGLTVRIPSAQLATPVLDESSSGVRNQDEGFFAGLFDTGDVNPSDLRRAARSHLSDQAQSLGLPAAAQRVAVAAVKAALRPLGITTVAVAVAG
jgi:uncharacterized protein DUF4230